jgi:hypothetical protein
VQPGGERLEHVARRLAEAQRVEVVDRVRAVDVEEEAARVQRVAAAVRHPLEHRDAGARVVGGDRRARARGAEADDRDVGHRSEA